MARYKASVTKVTAFETDEGIGDQCGDALGERSGRRLPILRRPESEPKGSARVGREAYSNHSNKNEWDPLEEDPPMGASSSTKVELRCRNVTGGGGKATTKKT